jgi:hypothetical protein
MSQSNGLHAYGSTLEVSADGVSYSAVAEVALINFPKEKVKEAKATHLLSDNAAEEKKPGMSATDDAKFMLNFTKAQLNTLKGYRRVTKYWRISAPLDAGETVPSRWWWVGFWKELGPEKFDPDDSTVIQVSLTVAVSGIINYTPGA